MRFEILDNTVTHVYRYPIPAASTYRSDYPRDPPKPVITHRNLPTLETSGYRDRGHPFCERNGSPVLDSDTLNTISGRTQILGNSERVRPRTSQSSLRMPRGDSSLGSPDVGRCYPSLRPLPSLAPDFQPCVMRRPRPSETRASRPARSNTRFPKTRFVGKRAGLQRPVGRQPTHYDVTKPFLLVAGRLSQSRR